MKKVLSIWLSVILILTAVTPMIPAQTVDEKIAPEVRAMIDSHTEGGVVVEISHHNPDYPTEGVSETEAVTNNLAAQRELLAQIEAVSYFEVGTFSVGRINVGLPYASIETVAALPNVDHIGLPSDQYCTLPAEQKLDERTKTAIETLSPDTKVHFTLWLAYNEHAYIGMAEPGDGASHAEVDHYLTVMRTAKRDYITAKNEEFARVIEESCEVENVSCLRYVPMLTLTARLSEIEKVASLKEVWTVSYSGIVYIPFDDPQALEEKFQNWLHMSAYDPELFEQGLQDYSETYKNYREVYSNGQWALVYAEINVFEPCDYKEHICLGSRVISYWRGGAAIYPYAYFVYNAAEDTFHPIERFVNASWGYDVDENYLPKQDENGNIIKIIHDPMISVDDYPGLFEALDLCKVGSLRGDADGDDEVTVLDATAIQRNSAELANTAFDEECADADGDGDATVLDATRVQRAVASLCGIDGRGQEDQPVQRPTEMLIGEALIEE